MKWQDNEGRTKSTPMYFDSNDITTLALAQTAYTGYEALLAALSGCALVEAEVCFPLAVSGAQNPDAGYNVNTGAILGFRDSDGIGQSMYIPGILEDKVIANVVDDEDGDITALVTEATNNGTLLPWSSRGSASLWAIYRGGKFAARKVLR